MGAARETTPIVPMAEPVARLILITPVLTDAALAPLLSEACAAGDVAAVIARLADADERSLVNAVKALAPAVQAHGAALLVALQGDTDPATVAARGGADGVHVPGEAGQVRDLKERLRDRSVGVGGIRTRDDAMAMGEAGADYLLFGEPRPDGSVPALAGTVERASWWAEIFETPCIAFAPTLEDVPTLRDTGAEFVAIGDAAFGHPDGAAAAVRAADGMLRPAGAGR
jgi:thiamine-phosphate pyrophosphorylase